MRLKKYLLNEKSYMAYHASFKEFDKFKQTKDIGYHFGTIEQARYFSARPYIYKVQLKMNKPYKMKEDWNQSHPEDLLGKLGKVFPPTEEDYWRIQEKIEKLPYDKGYEIIRNELKKRGYDGLIYPNEVEGKGLSYVVFSPNQIKIIEIHTKPD